MRSSQLLKSDVNYIKRLTEAVLDGITSPPRAAADRAFGPILTTALWTTAAIGAAIGALSVSLNRRRTSGYRVAAGGLLGSALGLGAGVAWTSRDFTGAVARNTLKKVNNVRDARWLEKNPIDYA
jgi:hypothetical protein